MNGVERAPAGTLLERTADIPVFIPISAVQSGNFHDKVRSILVLPGALGADHLALMKDIHPLAAEYCVSLGNQWQVVSTGPIPGRHGGSNRVRSGVTRIDAVISKEDRLIVAAHSSCGSDGWADSNAEFSVALLGGKYQRLVSMLLRPECTGYIFTAVHHTAPLIIEA